MESGPLSRLTESLSALTSFIRAPPASNTAAAASLLLADYKAANRAAALCVEEARARVGDASSAADARLLSLQNLQYERAHLAREIDRARGFPTPHLSALVSALPELAAAAGGGAHEEMLARLAAERVARGEEEAGVEEARGRLLALRGAARARGAFLESLPLALGAVEAALAPAEAGLGLPPAERTARHARTLGLPGPLYVLFSQLEAAAEALAAEAAEGGGAPQAAARVAGVDVVPAAGGGGGGGGGGGEFPLGALAVPASRLRLHAAALGLEVPPPAGGSGSGAPLKRERCGGEEALGSGGSGGGEDEMGGGCGGCSGGNGAPVPAPGCVALPLGDLLRPHPKAVLLALALPDGGGEGAEEGGMAPEGAAAATAAAAGQFAALRFEYLPLLDLVVVGVVGGGGAAMAAARAALVEGCHGGGAAPAPAPPLSMHCLTDLLCSGDDGARPAAWLAALASGSGGCGDGAEPPPMPSLSFGSPLWWAQAPAGLAAPPPPCPAAPRAPPAVAALLRLLRARLAGAGAAAAQVRALLPQPHALAPLLPLGAAFLLGGGRVTEWVAARCERTGALCGAGEGVLTRLGGARLAAARGALPAAVAALRALSAAAGGSPPAALAAVEDATKSPAWPSYFGGPPAARGARALRAVFAAGGARVQLLLRLGAGFPHGHGALAVSLLPLGGGGALAAAPAARGAAAAALARAAAPGDALTAMERLASLLGVAAAALLCPPAPEPALALLPCVLAGVAALLPGILKGSVSLPPCEVAADAFIPPGVL
jgi:hypothetical protein